MPSIERGTGMRSDIEPSACRAMPASEQIEAEPLPADGTEEVVGDAPNAAGAGPDEAARTTPSARVTITNRDKVFWPEEGYTKGDLINYYAAVSPAMVRFLRERPVVMVRYPDGWKGKSFYQWNVPQGTPDWLRRLDAAGVTFVNVSPTMHDIEEVPHAEWLPIRPHSDTALILALCHVLYTEGLHARDFLARCTVGFERFLPYLLGETDGTPKTPDWAAPICDTTPERIRDLARRMARSWPAGSGAVRPLALPSLLPAMPLITA